MRFWGENGLSECGHIRRFSSLPLLSSFVAIEVFSGILSLELLSSSRTAE
jgi:hypothetical protein